MKNARRWTALLLAVLLALSLLPAAAPAEGGEEPAASAAWQCPETKKDETGKWDYGVLEDGTAVITGFTVESSTLKIPNEVLEKPGKLTEAEFNVIKEHAFFTYETLKKIPGFDDVAQWAAFHHEKLNGSGYPLALKAGDIPLGAKIMAVADVFSAITEDRPYRTGMPREKTLAILDENAASGALSPELIAILKRHFDEINQARSEASAKAGARYYASFHEKASRE